jgi:hypothetical protein
VPFEAPPSDLPEGTLNLTSKTERLRKELAARDLLILKNYKKKKSST